MASKEKTHSDARPDVHKNAAERAASHHRPPASVQPVEAEDPKESAGDHHLQKKVLNENVEDGAALQHRRARPASTRLARLPEVTRPT